MSRTKLNKTTALVTNQKVVQGIGKHFTKVKTVTIGGVSYTPAALKALFQDEIDASSALDAIRAQVKEQVATIRPIRSKAGATRKALGAYILGTYGGNAAQVLEDFGITPPKDPNASKTAEVKAKGAARAAATRKARRAAAAAVASVSSPPAAATVATPAAQASPPAPVTAPAVTSTSH